MLLLIAGWATLKLPVFGGLPDALDIERFAASEQYNQNRSQFENRRPSLFDDMREQSLSLDNIGEWFKDRKDGEPSRAMPEQLPNLDAFMNEVGNRVIWFGHSTFLLNLSGTTVLVDPVFSPTAAPFGFTAKRFQPPVLSLDELPRIDLILISHDHYDHLDQKTIEFFSSHNSEFIVPLGVGKHLELWGIKAQRITERDWWQDHETRGIRFVAAPAQHFSGRDGFNNNKTLWASWAVLTDQIRLFFSGDSGYDTHFSEIGERLGPFDMAFMENGQYDQSWRAVHLLPTQTADAFEDLGASKLFPVHWGMFRLAFHTWYDPVDALSKIAEERGLDLVTPLIGQVLDLNAPEIGAGSR